MIASFACLVIFAIVSALLLANELPPYPRGSRLYLIVTFHGGVTMIAASRAAHQDIGWSMVLAAFFMVCVVIARHSAGHWKVKSVVRNEAASSNPTMILMPRLQPPPAFLILREEEAAGDDERESEEEVTKMFAHTSVDLDFDSEESRPTMKMPEPDSDVYSRPTRVARA
jgi:hypothetical protein